MKKNSDSCVEIGKEVDLEGNGGNQVSIALSSLAY
jgi:hypothetical protein